MPANIVVADTGPLSYLVLIGDVDILPQMFGAVAVPADVVVELRHPGAPIVVRAWATSPPPWLEIHDNPDVSESLRRLDPGERAAIALAHRLGAALLLLDDRVAALTARAEGFRVTGTIGVLIEAARRGLIDLKATFAALRATNFRFPPTLLDKLLEEHRRHADGGSPKAGMT